MNGQYNFKVFTPPSLKDAGIAAVITAILGHLDRQLTLISRALRGAVVFDAGTSGSAKTVNPTIADITELELTDNAAVTLSLTDLRKGMSGSVEFTQDAIGGWVPTFVNLVGSVPSIAAGIGKRTLVLFTHVGDGWVATVLASNY